MSITVIFESTIPKVFRGKFGPSLLQHAILVDFPRLGMVLEIQELSTATLLFQKISSVGLSSTPVLALIALSEEINSTNVGGVFPHTVPAQQLGEKDGKD